MRAPLYGMLIAVNTEETANLISEQKKKGLFVREEILRQRLHQEDTASSQFQRRRWLAAMADLIQFIKHRTRQITPSSEWILPLSTDGFLP